MRASISSLSFSSSSETKGLSMFSADSWALLVSSAGNSHPTAHKCPGLNQWIWLSSVLSSEVVMVQERRRSFTISTDSAAQLAFTHSRKREQNGGFIFPPHVNSWPLGAAIHCRGRGWLCTNQQNTQLGTTIHTCKFYSCSNRKTTPTTMVPCIRF